MFSFFDDHPLLVLLGAIGGALRFVLEITEPQYASVFGAAVGIPITAIIVRDHLALKRALRAEGLIR